MSERESAMEPQGDRRGTVLVFLPDRFADWEAGLACSEINKPETGYTVRTMAARQGKVRSIGGLTVVPDLTAERDKVPEDLALAILVGGDSWQEPDIVGAGAWLVDACLARAVPVAAICGACSFLAERGYLDDCDHTGNADYEFTQLAPHYRGHARFRNQPVVDGGRFITANGAAGIELACALFGRLDIKPWGNVETWRTAFKRGAFA